MLYLTSFQIVADFPKYSKDILLQVHIQFILPEKKFCFSSHLAEIDNIVN